MITLKDPHLETAAKIFNVPCDKVTEKQRAAAKAVNYWQLYGGLGSILQYLNKCPRSTL